MAKAMDKTIAWPEPSTQINVDDSHDLTFWSQMFRVGRETIKRAVLIVGHDFRNVQAYITAKRG